MPLIPTYQPDNIRPYDFSGLKEAFGQWTQNIAKAAQEDRLKKQAIQKVMSEYNSAMPWIENHKETASKMIEQFENRYAEMLTYDKNGKIKRFFGEPQLTDSEYVELQQMAAQMGQQFDKWKKADETMLKYTDEYKKNAQKYDSETFNIVDSDYKASGELTRSPLEVKPANVYDYISKLDPRTPDQLKQDTVPSGNTWITKSLDPEIQRQLYWQAATTDFSFQKGMVDMMMRDNTLSTNDKIQYIMGIMAPNLPYDKPSEYMNNTALREQVYKTYDEASRIVKEYQNERKFNPRLIEAAAYYDDQRFGLSKRIGKGGSRINETLYNYDQREARQKAEQEKEYTPTQEREYNIEGVPVTGIDLSRNSKTRLNNFQLPKGSYTMDRKEEIENPEYVKIKSKMENAKGRDKKNLERQLKDIPEMISRPRVDKSFIKDIGTADYEVVTYGEDGSGNKVIILKEPDRKDEYGEIRKGRYIFIPMEGNEEILKQINKNFKKDQEQQPELLDIPGF